MLRRLRTLAHLIRADFIERTRRYSFLITLGMMVYVGYLTVPSVESHALTVNLDLGIGYTLLPEGTQVETFRWEGMTWTADVILARLLWGGVALGIAVGGSKFDAKGVLYL